MDVGAALAFTALALPSLAYGVGVARTTAHIKALQDENDALWKAIDFYEGQIGRQPIRVDGLLRRVVHAEIEKGA